MNKEQRKEAKEFKKGMKELHDEAMSKEEKHIQNIRFIVLILVALLMFSIFYIIMNKNSFQEGKEAGKNELITSIIKQAEECKQIPIDYNNVVINVIPVGCLPQECLEEVVLFVPI